MILGPDPKNPRLTTLIVQAEHRLPEAEGEPPVEDSARYVKTGLPRWLALAGVVAGFALLIVPGIFAQRSYRRWQEGSASEPRAAWSVLALGLGVGVGALLWQRSTPVAAVAALVVTVVGLSLSAP